MNKTQPLGHYYIIHVRICQSPALSDQRHWPSERASIPDEQVKYQGIDGVALVCRNHGVKAKERIKQPPNAPAALSSI